jgi:hypothetical protein
MYKKSLKKKALGKKKQSEDKKFKNVRELKTLKY